MLFDVRCSVGDATDRRKISRKSVCSYVIILMVMR